MTYEIVNSINISLNEIKNTILWNSRYENKNKNIYSVLLKLESEKDFFRNKFYDFIFELSSKKVCSKTLEKYLEIEEGLSFFWFSSLGQKNIYENPKIITLLKFFALNELINEKNISNVNLNLQLEASVLKQFTELLKIKKINFEIIQNNEIKEKKCTSLISSLFYAFYFYFLRLNFLKNKKDNTKIALFDFLIEKKDESYSSYFTSLPDVLMKNNFSYTFSHLFFKRDFKNLFQTDFNFFSKRDHIIDREMNFKIFLSVVNNLLILNFRRKKLQDLPDIFTKKTSGINYSNLLLNDFIDSLINRDVIKGLFYHEIIKKYLTNNESFNAGIYPLENQPWENILVFNWKKIINNNIYGMIHTTARFWDLRMYYGKKYKKISQILPNKILSNSSHASINLLNGGYEKDIIIEVEALRYLDIRKNYSRKKNKSDDRILICGDFSHKLNNYLITINNKLLKFYNVDFLPHPTSKINHSISNLVYGKLTDLLHNYKIIITSSVSSSAVDAYENRKNVYQYVEEEGLNFSALSGLEKVIFFNKFEKLHNELKSKKVSYDKTKKSFFFLDKNLNRWDTFIKKNC